ncbi:membrane transporter [Microdochium trichocladiopsis]|uniref:Membrane transporter n=1 Tax=Microdochium trichocladiopsis TaxID=1682393 RepID=A0A9P8XXS2_9PEZI|nr:membrane transporter [Microdochium trichocladiopsis]KAH7024529.1 membrane transporter [Microdochium trichocladiopsis]
MEGLTLYEKKALVVNRELAQQGMGRYQWMVFFLCGFGYFLDLLWAQAFGLILASIKQEFGFGDIEAGNLSTAFNAGLTAGALFWGIVTDIIGRYWAFNFTVLIASVFGICLGAPDTYNGVLVLAAFVGIGIGGNVPIDTTICLELLPRNKRWLLPTLSVFQPLGVIVCSAISYAFIPWHSCAPNLKSCNTTLPGEPCCAKADNWGWRYTMFTLGGITITAFIARFFLFKFKESPKFLLFRGNDAKAVEVLEYIANFNKVPCNVTLESFTSLTEDDASVSGTESDGRIVLGSGEKQKNLSLWQKVKFELVRLRVLFDSPVMAWLTICVFIIYMFDYFAFSISGAFLPYILRSKGAQLGLGLQWTYLSYIYIKLFGIPGVLAGTTIYKWRRLSMIASSALFGAMLFTFTTVTNAPSYIGISGLVYCFQSMFNAILYGMTPEFFPAPIRGTACGAASFWGRVFSIIAPLAGARVLAVSQNGVLYLAGSSAFISTIFICLLPGRYIGGQSY